MRAPLAWLCLIGVFIGVTVLWVVQVESQEPPAVTVGAPQAVQGPAPTPVADAAPEVPKGVDVMARGPVHEGFAAPGAEPKPTQAIAKKPPAPMEELPPEDRPDGDVVWIGGYWAYDDDRKDFLWVSGCWRVKPENKEWVPGYWREVSEQWQWVAGFWANGATAAAVGATAAPAAGKIQDVTYYPEPPAPPKLAPPGAAPAVDFFYVPGYYQWTGTYYVWRAGYWTRVRPGYVYVASHYCWTPTGYVYVAGYWDYTIARRGVMYAPVVVDGAVVPAGFVYTPAYAVNDTLVLDAMFVQPAYCHYYFGDYYGPVYAQRGFVTTVVYSQTCYEPIVVYQRYEYRDNPRWFDLQISLVFDRDAGRAPLPPRTLAAQQSIINNTTIVNNTVINKTTINNTTVNNKTVGLMPARTLMAAKGIPSTPMSAAARTQVKQASQAVQVAAATQRRQTEHASGPSTKPRTASLSVPTAPVAPKTPSVSPAGHTAAGTPSALGAPPKTTTPATGTSQTKGAPATGATIKGTTGAPATGTTTPAPGTTVTSHPGATGNPLHPMPNTKKGHDEKKKDKQ
jgi:hypothetical protein